MPQPRRALVRRPSRRATLEHRPRSCSRRHCSKPMPQAATHQRRAQFAAGSRCRQMPQANHAAHLPLRLVPQGQQIADDVTAHINTPPPPFRGALPAAQPVRLVLDRGEFAARDRGAPSARRYRWRDRAADAAAGGLAAGSGRRRRPAGSIRSRRDGISKFRLRRRRERRWRSSRFRATAAATRPRRPSGSWRARFSLDVEPAGPVHALVSLSGDRTSVRMWAERPATADQLRAGVAQLSQALSRAELQPGDIVIRDGAPPQPASGQAGHFLDRAL